MQNGGLKNEARIRLGTFPPQPWCGAATKLQQESQIWPEFCKKVSDEDEIRTHASEETTTLTWRVRPLRHFTTGSLPRDSHLFCFWHSAITIQSNLRGPASFLFRINFMFSILLPVKDQTKTSTATTISTVYRPLEKITGTSVRKKTQMLPFFLFLILFRRKRISFLGALFFLRNSH